MANRNLTEQEWAEFWRMPLEERIERCKNFSQHDSFRLRISDPGSSHSPWVPCNDCAYRLGLNAACKAYPQGLTAEHIRAVMDNPSIECGDGFRFVPKEQDNVQNN